MTTLEVLRGMRELLSEPSRWTKHRYSRAADGEYVAATSKKAVCWCLRGAAVKVAGGFAAAADAECLIEGLLPNGSPIAPWQDDEERTHAEVLALLDKAIESERAKGGEGG